MSKTEIVTELQTILNDLKGITADLEQNISGLKDFLEDRKFIPKELGASRSEEHTLNSSHNRESRMPSSA